MLSERTNLSKVPAMTGHRVRTLLLTTLLTSAAATGWTREAKAQEAHGFGEKGQLMFSADRFVQVLGYTRSSVTSTTNNSTTTSSSSNTSLAALWAGQFGGADLNAGSVHTIPRVAADFVVIPRLTIGGAFAFTFGLGGSDKTETSTGGTTTTASLDAPRGTALGIAPRVGYILPLTSSIAFWPRAGFGFYAVTIKSDRNVGNQNAPNIETSSRTATTLSLDLDPQLAIVPTEHFFIHVGPLVNIPLSGSVSTKTTQGAVTTETSNNFSLFHFGISAGIGGWLNL